MTATEVSVNTTSDVRTNSEKKCCHMSCAPLRGAELQAW